MLSDIERKLHRIIVNFSKGRSRLPSIHELEIKTGRDREGIFEVLRSLDREGYLVWFPADPEPHSAHYRSRVKAFCIQG